MNLEQKRRLVTPVASDDQQILEVPSSEEGPECHLNVENLPESPGPFTEHIADRSLRAACQRVVESRSRVAVP